MASIQCKGMEIELNEEGFLVRPEAWDEDVALALAQAEEGLDELGEAHWAILRHIRAHWLEHDSAPMVRTMCKATGVPLREIYDLFPSGPAKGACKLAGLPRPDGCV